jgi:DNA-binding beta-propeller fold protein YncE
MTIANGFLTFSLISHLTRDVAQFESGIHQVIASVPIGSGPDVVGFDPGLNRIYAAGKGGKLSVVQQDTRDAHRKVEDISTHYGAHTLVVDPAGPLLATPACLIIQELPSSLRT